MKHEVKSYLGIKDIQNVRVLIRYDVENISEDTFKKACNGIFAEPPVDTLYAVSYTHLDVYKRQPEGIDGMNYRQLSLFDDVRFGGKFYEDGLCV